MNFQHDLDEEVLKLTLCLRKEIPYEEMNLRENKMRIEKLKLSVNNKHRMDTIKRLIKE